MKRFFHILLLLFALFTTGRVSAQYYTWGADPTVLKWNSIRCEKNRIIYPDTAAAYAVRTLFCIEKIQPYIAEGFRHGPMTIPFVLHPENFESNGLVMWLPKRVEFLTSPAVESYSMPWYKQLTAHEYRHAVQYNNLNQGVIKALSYLLGQQGSTVGLLFLPIWIIEGDAVLSETQMSSFGRGLQPRFTLEYRALGREMLRRRNLDKWFCGSYIDFIPDHYQLGYQIAAHSYNRFGENIWDKVAWYGARNPYVLFTVPTSLKKFYKTSVPDLFRSTFRELNDYWDSLPEEKPTTQPLNEVPGRNYTIYQWPIQASDTTALFLKSALNRPSRFVQIDTRTGREQKMRYTGRLSTRPALGEDGRLWWTEYRRSMLFPQRVNSQLCYMDLEQGKPRHIAGVRNALYPTPTSDGIAWVEYLPNGSYNLRLCEGGQERCLAVPFFKEVHGLAWDNSTDRFYLLITDDDGMWIASMNRNGDFTPVTRGAYITLSDLRARDGWLYFGSIQSGKDEAHAYDLNTGREYRLTTSRYGAFSPAPLNEKEVLVTDYTVRGYRPARQRLDSLRPVAYAPLPENRLNPPRRTWQTINLDTVRFSAADSLDQDQKHHPKRYRKGLNLFKLHSWMPLSINPFSLVDEMNIDLNWGVTLLSQNLLSTTEAYASWGWNRNEGSIFRLGARYFGLGAEIEIAGFYGGNQQIYALAQINPSTGKLEHQAIPKIDPYYSLSASVTLPLYFQRGYHTRQLTVAAGWNFSNGLVAKLGDIRFDEKTGGITNISHIGYSEGLHKLAFTLGFSDVVRTAPREFAPRWGYLLTADYALNPSNEAFSDLISLYGRLYLPGITRPHSLMLSLNYQTSFAGFQTPDGVAMLTYKSNRLIPHGYTSNQIRSDHYTAAALHYQLPIWYPEGGIPSVIYFKRIRLNLGVDYAQYRTLTGWNRLYAYGGDLLFDFNLFRQPDSATSTLKVSLYNSHHNGLWWGLSLGLPF
ncbi:MAG: hypothetical protein IJX56_03165 [Alistipes sp.]|nr:hypothetical protein [Alistipes sp.]